MSSNPASTVVRQQSWTDWVFGVSPEQEQVQATPAEAVSIAAPDAGNAPTKPARAELDVSAPVPDTEAVSIAWSIAASAAGNAPEKIAGSELDVSSLDPDADGDGNVSRLEQEIYQALKAADIDGSGSIGVGELYKVIGDLVGEKRKVKSLSRLVIALVLLVVLALASIFVVSLLAGEAIKESKVNGVAMTTPDGLSAVAVDTVESTTTLWDLPAVDTASLAKMKDLVFYADLSTYAAVGGWVEATYKVAGVYKASNDQATVVMTSGEKVTIRRTARTGDLLMDGVTYPISDECTGACSAGSRRLTTDITAGEPVAFGGPRTLNRAGRKLGFFSALMTSGSFMMMQAGAF